MNLRAEMNTITKGYKDKLDNSKYYEIMDYIMEMAKLGEFSISAADAISEVKLISDKLAGEGFTVEIKPELYRNLKISWE